jgi:queuosine precursor transporter
MQTFIKYPGAISYLLLIFLVNLLFPHMPVYTIFDSPFSACDFTVGAIYIARDFAQREVGKNVLYLMIAGCLLSYAFANKQIAIASILAFIVGETIDWGIYTYARRPFSQRLLASSMVSVPFDTAIFLYFINQLNIAGFMVMTTAKLVGISCVWLLWQSRKNTPVANFP